MSVKIEKKGFVKSFTSIVQGGTEAKPFEKQTVVLCIPEVSNDLGQVLQYAEYYQMDIMNRKFVINADHIGKPVSVVMFLRTYQYEKKETKELAYGMSLSLAQFEVIVIPVKTEPTIASADGTPTNQVVAEQLIMPLEEGDGISLNDLRDINKPTPKAFAEAQEGDDLPF